jgi:thioredoxin-like negative regulator of GroEL
MLVFVYSGLSGRCRRAEGYLAQVLQRRHNHETFRVTRLDAEARPDLAERFRIASLPTLLVVEDKVIRGRLEDPRGCRDIASFLEPWLN